MFFDTHCHFFEEDIDEVLKKAKQNGVFKLILAGCDKKDNLCNLSLAKEYKEIYATIGYHPDTCERINNADLKLLEEQIKNNKIVAIGEIGLDYHYEKDNKELQKKLFTSQLDLAKKYNLPVVIHSRDAVSDTLKILKKYNLKGVMHCFSGSYEVALEYTKLGYKLGIGGVITFKNSNLKEVIKKIGLDNIVLETDSPYLSPIRGEKNDPSNILIIAKYISELFGVTLQDISLITNKNVEEVFGINCK